MSFTAPWIWEQRKNKRILAFTHGMVMRLKDADRGAEGTIYLGVDNGLIVELSWPPGLSTNDVTLTFWRFTDGHGKSLAPSVAEYVRWRRRPWDTALLRPIGAEDPRVEILEGIQDRIECGPVRPDGLWRQKPKTDDPASAILGLLVSTDLRDWVSKAGPVAAEFDTIEKFLESITGDALTAPKAWWGTARKRYSPLPPRASDPRPRA